jgi:tRNA(adenine34) deaminase
MGQLQPESDEFYMRLALEQGNCAALSGEIPVGAVIVKDGHVVSVGHNGCIANHDPTAHAEVVALRAAASKLQNYRLEGCELFVTLEPCAMCAGALLHARLKRVVFGARDPKTGALGSVFNLFEKTELNHQTSWTGGVLERACATQLQDFFKARREASRATSMPLREDALRTPEARFDALPGYPWKARYINDLPVLDGLRMHYLDEGPTDANTVFLCLHGNPGWSYLYRKMLPVWNAAGHRVVAPDLIGFGKSDKPKRDSSHSFDFHRECLIQLVQRLDLRNVMLVVQDWGGILGLTLPMEMPDRFAGILIMNTMLAAGDEPLSEGFLAWRDMCERKPEFDVGRLFARSNPNLSPAECEAYNAPFPDAGHRAALRAFPTMVPQYPDSPGARVSRLARDYLRDVWHGKSWMVVGAQDPVFGPEFMGELRKNIRGCADPLLLQEAGHFVQEHGERIARAALQHLATG